MTLRACAVQVDIAKDPSKDNWATRTPLSGKQKVQGEFVLIYLCYNFKGVFIILGVMELADAQEALTSSFIDKMNTTVTLWAHKTIPLIFPIFNHGRK
jgi:hypothetical protein